MEAGTELEQTDWVRYVQLRIWTLARFGGVPGAFLGEGYTTADRVEHLEALWRAEGQPELPGVSV